MIIYPSYPTRSSKSVLYFNPMFFRFITSVFCLFFFSVSLSSAENYRGVITRIVDGDTLRVNVNGQDLRVRLLGIDTLEKTDNEKSKKDSVRLHQDEAVGKKGGLEASAYLMTLLKKGDTVTLETDKEEFDQYGRTLAYIYDAKGTFINKKLISDGYAGLLVYSPNEEKAEELDRAFLEAKEAHRGLWGEGFNLQHRWKRTR